MQPRTGRLAHHWWQAGDQGAAPLGDKGGASAAAADARLFDEQANELLDKPHDNARAVVGATRVMREWGALRVSPAMAAGIETPALVNGGCCSHGRALRGYPLRRSACRMIRD